MEIFHKDHFEMLKFYTIDFENENIEFDSESYDKYIEVLNNKVSF